MAGKNKNKTNLRKLPFDNADAITSRIEAFMAANFIHNDGVVTSNDLLMEYFSTLHLELTKAPSVNRSVLNRLTREFHATNDVHQVYLEMLPNGMRQHVKAGKDLVKVAFSDPESGYPAFQGVLYPSEDDDKEMDAAISHHDTKSKMSALADIIPLLEEDLFDESKWETENDQAKFARFQMINTTRMMLREIWLNASDRASFLKALSPAYQIRKRDLGEESGFFDTKGSDFAPKRPYQPDFFIQKWHEKDPLFSGAQFDKLVQRLEPLADNDSIGWVQSFARRQTSGRKNVLKEEFRDVKTRFVKQLGNLCEDDLLQKGVPVSVVEMMKEGRLPAGSGYDVEHLGDRALGGTNDHDNLCFVDRLYNKAAADLTSFQTQSLLPGGLRTIYEPMPRAFKDASMAIQQGTAEFNDGYRRQTPESKAIVPLDKRILISGVAEESRAEPV